MQGGQTVLRKALKAIHNSAPRVINVVHEIRPQRPQPGDEWDLDEVCVKIKCKTYYLWWTVDQDGTVLDLLMHSH